MTRQGGDMTCPRCGTPLESNARSCQACGEQRHAETTSRPLLGPPPAVAAGDVAGNGRAGDLLTDLKVLSSEDPNAHYLGQRLLYQSSVEMFVAEFRAAMRERLDTSAEIAR